jgi:hypothetical protein
MRAMSRQRVRTMMRWRSSASRTPTEVVAVIFVMGGFEENVAATATKESGGTEESGGKGGVS